MEILLYLGEYFKTNTLTLWGILFLALISVLKYFKFGVTAKLNARTWLVLILLLGFLLRLGWLGLSGHEPMMSRADGNPMENDLINIHAIELTKGIWFEDNEGNPSGRRPIGYPMALALFYKIFGAHVVVAWCVQLALFLCTSCFIYLIGKFTFSKSIGLLATFFYSIYPTSIYSIKLITDEHLLVALWYGGVVLLLREMRGSRLKFGWLWYGLIFGYATMVRTHTIFMPVVVGLVALLKKSSIKRAALVIILVGMVMQLINLPWVIRNYKAWGVPVLYTATGGFVYGQVNDAAKPSGGGQIPARGEPGFSAELEQAIESQNEGRIHQEANRQMVKWIATHPARFVTLGVARVLDFMCWNRKGGVWPLWYQMQEGHYRNNSLYLPQNKKMFEEMAFIAYYVVLFSCAFGVILALCRWQSLPPNTRGGLVLIGSLFFFWLLEHMIIYPDRKYRYPLEPLMILVGCYFLRYVHESFRWERLLEKLMHFTAKKQTKS
jgi:4-amino-4-deoxy-L-arabinose transferase-like glycosyltransferase